MVMEPRVLTEENIDGHTGGQAHETTCGDEPSIHLTLYNYAYRWRDLLWNRKTRLETCMLQPSMRSSGKKR